MLYILGNRRDYDRWEQQLGCEGWGWRSVLPYFINPRTTAIPGSPTMVTDIYQLLHSRNVYGCYHGGGGYLTVSTPPYASPLAHAFVQAEETLGYPNIDLNGPIQSGEYN
ncbi:hypothetical protein HPB52_009717 [Rhipicephalus sanguineus]|uniref:Glucose-methanol-choline oxidoreductase N-terminal domain-containing protein n=1 Tax=Rhipicephalus sanguineus TaxID=34632 RepID=A0A9D4PGQ3_RHISA|nr:hypothetical protein HPB52_009717 [Rhipicephalus sanguineus]